MYFNIPEYMVAKGKSERTALTFNTYLFLYTSTPQKKEKQTDSLFELSCRHLLWPTMIILSCCRDNCRDSLLSCIMFHLLSEVQLLSFCQEI